jgi:hypothetical protein
MLTVSHALLIMQSNFFLQVFSLKIWILIRIRIRPKKPVSGFGLNKYRTDQLPDLEFSIHKKILVQQK